MKSKPTHLCLSSTQAGWLALLLVGLMPALWACQQAPKATSDTADSTRLAISDTLKWAERMALSTMKRHPVAFQIDNHQQPKWDYVHGLELFAFERLYTQTQNPRYADYVQAYADTLIDAQGNIRTYKLEDYNIDMLNAGKILFRLHHSTALPQYKLALDRLRRQLSAHPRTKDGGFWHKKRYPNQMWLDGLYMGAPFYARYTVEFEDGAQLDDVARQFELIQAHLLDTKTGLLYHGWDESREMAWADPTTGCSPNFWSRSLGWYAMALVDVLDYFPAEHPKRPALLGYLASLADALVRQQDSTGLWYQVTDQGARAGNYLEASGTAMFAYAFARAANQGYLPSQYRQVAQKAFDGLLNKLIRVQPDGEVVLTEVCAVAGLGGTPFRDGSYEYYINERKRDNDPKGTGPFVLAAIELGR